MQIFSLSVISLTLAAYEDEKYYRTPPPPRILSHKQTQNHDGGFKFAFAAENGLAQTEVIAPDGSRNGGYTYVDPHGKTITVKYTAGKDGFRILEGEHIPREVHAHPNDRPVHQPHYEHDDGSYKPERDEHPYDDTNPANKPGLQAYRAPVYHQQVAPQPHPQPQLQLQYKPNFAPPHYVKAYIPQGHPLPQPRHYAPVQVQAPATEHEQYSNSVESDVVGKAPVYNDAPGKPYSFGAGYAFSFQN